MTKPREWWIGITADGWSKWLTNKHPNETKCRNVFISTDGSDPCVEYVPVIEAKPNSIQLTRDELREALGKALSRLIKTTKEEFSIPAIYCDFVDEELFGPESES